MAAFLMSKDLLQVTMSTFITLLSFAILETFSYPVLLTHLF